MGTRISAMVKVDGVASVQVGSLGDEWGFSVPKCASVAIGRKPKVIRVFAETVEIWVQGKACPETDVLRFEIDWRVTRVE